MEKNNRLSLDEFELGTAELEVDLPSVRSIKRSERANNVKQPTKTRPKMSVELDCSNCMPDNYCCIEVNDICIRYGTEKIVENVSLNIFRNSITAIIGPSGCGKSSFLCSINKLTDLIPDCEVSGCIKFEWDETIYTKKAQLLRKHVGMLFQKPNPFPFSIWRNLEFPLKEHGVTDSDEIAKRIEKSLIDVGLWNEVKDRLKASALSLSGGQQQRLCLARALILEPTVMLMDEPCSALDPMATKKIEELTQQLSKKMTVILVTHNLSQARRVADYVALFWKENDIGRLIEYKPVNEFFESATHELTKNYLAYC